jgi:hypothetical protein
VSKAQEKSAGNPADIETSAGIEKARHIIALVGNTVGALALLVALGVVAAILWFTNDGVPIGDVIEDDYTGTTTIAFPFLMLVLSLIGFFFGQFASRGRWGTGPNTSVWSSGTFRVVLNPISVALHALFFALAVIAWALVLPVPVFLDASASLTLPEGSSEAEQFWFTVSVYGAVTGGLAAIVGVSLLKKLTYNRSLERGRSSIVDKSSSQVAWRRFSHIWRGELMIAALGGAALGLAPLGVHLDSAAYGFAFAGAGIGLVVAAVVLALNAWRSGLPVERVESYT